MEGALQRCVFDGGRQEAGRFYVILRPQLQHPCGDFFRWFLYYFRLDLVHLFPNFVTIVSSFIRLSEAYIGIPPHFHLWWYFFQAKKIGSSGAVGVVGFYLRPSLKSQYIDIELPTTTTTGDQSGSTSQIRSQSCRSALGSRLQRSLSGICC